MANSDNLRKAKEAKNDEFYTQLEDIVAEIAQHKDYVRQFQGKTVSIQWILRMNSFL